MKKLKVVGMIVAGLILVMAVVVGIAFTSSFQTWFVRRQLAGIQGMQISVERVSAGLSSARVEGIRVLKDGTVATVGAVVVRGSAMSYLSGGRIDIDEFSVSDLVVDMSKPPATSTGTAAGAGISGAGLKPVQLPFDVRIGKIAVSGRAALPDNRSATFSLTGGGIRTGGDGQLDFKADLTDAKPAAPLAALHLAGRASIRIAPDRRVDSVILESTLSVDGPNLPPETFKLVANAMQPSAGADENYSVVFGLNQSAGMVRILDAHGVYRNAANSFSGDWDIALRNDQLVTLLKQLKLPQLAVTGSGKLDFSIQQKSGAASGEFTTDASKLENISPALASLGSAKFKGGFDVRLADNTVRLERGDVTVSTATGAQLAEAVALQKPEFNLAEGKLSKFDAAADLARVTITQLPLAWAQPFLPDGKRIESGDFSGGFTVKASADGARIQVLSTDPVSARNFSYSDTGTTLIERATIAATPRIEYAGDTAVINLPSFALTNGDGDRIGGSGTLNITGLKAKPAVDFDLVINGRAAKGFLAFLPGVAGPVTIDATTKGRVAKNLVELRALDSEIKKDGGGFTFGIKAAQSVRINTDDNSMTVANAASPALVVRMDTIPLVWAKRFAPDYDFAGTLSAGEVQVFARTDGSVQVRSSTQAAFRAMNISSQGSGLLRNVDVSTDFTLTRSGTSIAYEIKGLNAVEAGRSILKVEASGAVNAAASLSISGKGQVDADIGALARQPLFAKLSGFSRGTVSATFDAKVQQSNAINIDAKAAVRNLALREGNVDIGPMDASIALVTKPDGSMTLKAPLVLGNAPRRSDILLDAALGAATTSGRTFNGKLSGDQLVADDLIGLAGAFSAGPATPAPASLQVPPPTAAGRGGAAVATAPASIVADRVAFWSGFSGRISTEFKQVRYGATAVITGVKGTLALTENNLALEGFEGRYGTDPYTLSGAIAFKPGQARPYSLTGKANVSNLQVGEILKALNPQEKPALESKVNVVANLGGTGRNAGDLAQSVTGKFEITGGAGVLRALGRKGGAVGTLSTIVGIIGAVQQSQGTSAVAALMSDFEERKFDRFNAVAERGADLSIKLTSLEFFSPTARITGTGVIQHRSDGSILEQPMNIQFKLMAKDYTAVLLQRINLLGSPADSNGYYPMARDFAITGTPANPDSSDLWKILLGGAASGLLGR